MNERSRILIVDDELNNRQLLNDILEDDFTVYEASSGLSCLEQVAIHHPDLILLDIMMPDMDGFETCRELKNRNSSKHIPVVFVTALDERTEAVEGFRIGAADYIVKPFTKSELTSRIRAILSGHNRALDITSTKIINSENLEDIKTILCEISVSIAKSIDRLQLDCEKEIQELQEQIRKTQELIQSDSAEQSAQELLKLSSSVSGLKTITQHYSAQSNEQLHELGRIINRIKQMTDS